jgi:phage shock protein E
MNYLLKNKVVVLGVMLGALAGYLYYFYIGCNSGTCLISSKPINSTLYGAFLGMLTVINFKNIKQL